MLNYFNFTKFQNVFLITNDFGKYAFLTPDEFKQVLTNKYKLNEKLNYKLEQNLFVYDSSQLAFLEKNSYRYIDSKNYLFQSTSLHIFVVTNACNQKCLYCQAQNGKCIPNGFMSKETAKKAVDLALQSPAKFLNFEFQGGEPLMNFDIIKYIVEYSKCVCDNKNINYSLVSNLTLLTDEMIDFIIDNKISLSTSIDGDERLHNINRPYRNGIGTYKDVIDKVKYLKEKEVNIGALETTTKYSLKNYKEIIDTYINLGFDTVSIRALTPLGCANFAWNDIGYSPDEFVEFYKKSFEYILEVNKNGYRLTEGQATIILHKILTGVSQNYMELRSPCGAAVGQMAYYYDGNVYTCDEGRMLAEMGNEAFKLGNLYEDTYDTLMNSQVCKAACSASILESLPTCSDCVYQPYCGTCPVVTFALNDDLYEKEPFEYRCKIYKGILDTIFSYLLNDNSRDIDIFRSWIK